ncbi:LysR family transcriptional regulator, partial [Actinotalea sp.]|uniref:LysR family transcriptional regulator n=1 Tax=Actinotalea sp. TaxID=1872145 RepID=UPI002CF764AC
MDPLHLETLRAVHDRGGVTAAALVLRLTPSAVSQQLKALQRVAGVPLTERVGRGLRLTPAGEALAASAVDVAVALRRAEAACDAFLARPTGTVRLAAFQSGAQMLVPGLLTRLAADPGITLQVADEDVAQRDFPALTADADVVLAHRPDRGHAWDPAVRVVPLLREPLDVALPLGHRLADRES